MEASDASMPPHCGRRGAAHTHVRLPQEVRYLLAKRTEPAQTIDPITFEVLRNAFSALCNEMALVVGKTAYSTPVNEGRDLAGAFYDRNGKLVSQGEFDCPAFVGLTMLTVPEVIRAIGLETMRPGDIYMINDPYVASTHCNDIHQVNPIFHEGELVGFVSSTAHWSDVGGVAPGSLNCRARSHFEEGVRIPALRIYREGILNKDVVAILMANMRQSWERLGDLNAQTAAVRAGEARVQAMIEKHGLPTLLAVMEGVQDYSEQLSRAAWRSLPDGVYKAEDKVDQDVYTGEPVTVRLTLTIEGEHATFDLTESDGAAESGINCTIAATTSGVFIGMGSILPPMPMNSGVMRTVEIKAKRGSIVWAQPPVGISGLAATTMECIMGSCMQALSEAMPERGAATPFSILNTVFAGHDTRPQFDSDFVNYVWGLGGLGGTQSHDGPNVASSSYSSSCQNIPCELQERRYPVLWRNHDFTQDSGGPGQMRGGVGLRQVMEFPYTDGTISCIGDRERFGPPGVFGGEPGGRAGLVINQASENERNIGIFCVNAPAATGERMSFWSAGGGGFGDPLQRDTQRVVEDVKDEYVSIPAAREQYGVVIHAIDPRTLQYKVDEDATAKLRAERLATRA